MEAMHAALNAQEDTSYFGRVPVYTYDPASDVYPLPATASTTSPTDWRQLLAQVPLQSSFPMSAFSATTRTAVILWSSGTSGRSKGVLLSHHALNYSTAAFWHDADFYLGQRQHWLGYVPFYHVFGLCNSLLLSICAGATVYVMSAFNLDSVLAAVPKRGITYFHMAPPVAVMLAKSPVVEPYAKKDPVTGRNAFSTVVAGVSGGAPLGHEVIVEVYRRLGFRIRLGYGLSETCGTSMQRGLSESEMHSSAGDSGIPHYGVELVIDAAGHGGNDAVVVPAEIGKPGEILVRCPALMLAYLPAGGLQPDAGHEPDMSATLNALTPDGWFRTGDVGNINAEGKLSITDRLKELIKVRGFQVAPAELEAVLCSNDHIADAGVIGVYDEGEATEYPKAYVVPQRQRLSETELHSLAIELKAFIEKRAARYKWLHGGIVFVDQIPKSLSGKILRRVLKQGDVKGTEVQLYLKKARDTKL